MKSIHCLLASWLIILVGCSKSGLLTRSSIPENSNVEFLGYAKDLPTELIQQYVLSFVDTVTIDTRRSHIAKEVKELYRFSNNNLLWTTRTSPNSDAKELLNELLEVSEHGLNPEHYVSDSLLIQFDDTYAYNQEIDVLDLIDLDVKLSTAFIKYSYDLHYGQIDASQLGDHWIPSKRHVDLAPYLAGKGFKEGVRMIAPKNKDYRSLQKKLQSYLALQDEGGWNNIPDSMRVNIGESHEAIYLLRDRLYYSGDYNKGIINSSKGLVFDRDLQMGLIKFQERHGLKTSGLLNAKTIQAMNVSIEKRIDQIKINLERLKWMEEPETDKYIVVNIPDFKLKLLKKEKEIRSFKAIVGKSTSKTPILSDQIEFITFSPSWFVSDMNFNRHILPKAKQDPQYLELLGYKLYARQDLKGENPLDINEVQWSGIDVINSKFRALHTPNPNDKTSGKIKFSMPNTEDLFICDAPSPDLFEFSYRSFNYSSISVENPELLAKYLLNDRDWNIMAIQEHMQGEKPENIPLEEKVAVNVVYLTVWVDSDGSLQFRDDIYGYDQLHSNLLKLEDHRANQK